MTTISGSREMPMLPLTLPHTETFAEWSSLGHKLCAGARVMNWLIGDWLIDGTENYGAKARDEANRIFRADVERFDPILKTCRRFPEDKRHDRLTFGHHAAVMAIPDDAEAEKLLSEAETERATVASLKAKVRVINHTQASLIEDDDPEDTAMRAIVQAWNRAPKTSREAFLELASESHMGVIDL